MGIEVERGGPIYVLSAEGATVDPGLGGGAPPTARPTFLIEVCPCLLWVPASVEQRSSEPQSVLRVAASLAALLAVPPPYGAETPPLYGFQISK